MLQILLLFCQALIICIVCTDSMLCHFLIIFIPQILRNIRSGILIIRKSAHNIFQIQLHGKPVRYFDVFDIITDCRTSHLRKLLITVFIHSQCLGQLIKTKVLRIYINPFFFEKCITHLIKFCPSCLIHCHIFHRNTQNSCIGVIIQHFSIQISIEQITFSIHVIIFHCRILAELNIGFSIRCDKCIRESILCMDCHGQVQSHFITVYF